jgi:uncharacterized protein
MTEALQALMKVQDLDRDVARGEVEPTAYRKRKRRELLRQVPDAVAKNYFRVRGRHEDAIVPVVNGVCTGCFVQLPALVMARMTGTRDAVYCDHCGRLLYREPQLKD